METWLVVLIGFVSFSLGCAFGVQSERAAIAAYVLGFADHSEKASLDTDSKGNRARAVTLLAWAGLARDMAQNVLKREHRK